MKKETKARRGRATNCPGFLGHGPFSAKTGPVLGSRVSQRSGRAAQAQVLSLADQLFNWFSALLLLVIPGTGVGPRPLYFDKTRGCP